MTHCISNHDEEEREVGGRGWQTISITFHCSGDGSVEIMLFTRGRSLIQKHVRLGEERALTRGKITRRRSVLSQFSYSFWVLSPEAKHIEYCVL